MSIATEQAVRDLITRVEAIERWMKAQEDRQLREITPEPTLNQTLKLKRG